MNINTNHRILFLVCAILIAIPAFAENEWFGNWQSELMTENNETMILEYDFKNGSELTMSFITDNQTPNIGRFVSRITIDGSYNKIGPLFFVSLDNETIEIEILKLLSTGRHISESEMKQTIRKNAEPLLSGFDDVRMIYVTHENPDEISFIFGDEGNVMEMEFHRPSECVEKLLNITDD